MHEKNVVHQNLKLENILCKQNGDIILTDFGFAQLIEGT